MNYTKKQIDTLEKMFRKHIHSSKDDKALIEESMKKYGFNNPGEVYKLLKSIKRQDKEETRDLA